MLGNILNVALEFKLYKVFPDYYTNEDGQS